VSVLKNKLVSFLYSKSSRIGLLLIQTNVGNLCLKRL
jgi:hypothetical protein